jgi:hypothetical protein
MARRRVATVQAPDSRAPEHLAVCDVSDWTTGDPADLECDRSRDGLPCALTCGPHDEWCAVMTARRRWYAARAATDCSGLPHAKPQP